MQGCPMRHTCFRDISLKHLKMCAVTTIVTAVVVVVKPASTGRTKCAVDGTLYTYQVNVSAHVMHTSTRGMLRVLRRWRSHQVTFLKRLRHRAEPHKRTDCCPFALFLPSVKVNFVRQRWTLTRTASSWRIFHVAVRLNVLRSSQFMLGAVFVRLLLPLRALL